MDRSLNVLLLIGILFLAPQTAAAQIIIIASDDLWPDVDPGIVVEATNPPRSFFLRNISLTDLNTVLAQAPAENSSEPPAILALPLPDGTFADVEIFESPVLAPGFSIVSVTEGNVVTEPLPDLVRAYAFRGKDDRTISGRLTIGNGRVQALLQTRDGLVRISPTATNLGVRYASFLNRDRTDGADDFDHSIGEQLEPDPPNLLLAARQQQLGALAAQTGSVLRTFRLAVATTGEYTQAIDAAGPADLVTDVVNAVMTEVNNVNTFLESEVAVRLLLSNVVIYLDPDNDPYDPAAKPNSPPACVVRDENAAIDGIVGAGNYDVGFAFGAGPPNNIGCAWYVLCQADKYRGAALINVGNPPGNATGVLAHEMGHQLDARHTFSGSACPPIEYNAQAAYEPGSGTTVMSYSGACNEDADGDGNLDVKEDANDNGMLDAGEDLDGDGNLDIAEDRNGNNVLDNDNVDNSQVGNGFYYHGISFDEIVANTTALVTGGVCGAEIATANLPPVVDAGSDYTIPRNTPFRLTGNAIDPDGDVLRYAWEQFDQGNPARLIDSATTANGPILRSVPPLESPDAPDFSRTFPRMPDLLANIQRPGEILPVVNRTMDFRLTARDNLTGGGGVASDEMRVTVAGSPFFVIEPNGGEDIGGGCVENVSWVVGGGDVAASVNIELSEDGGGGFSTLPMGAGVANDGNQAVMFSCTATDSARVQVAAVDNIFFDFSDDNFSISPRAPLAAVNQASGGEVDETCSFTVTFAATVTDDCGVLAQDVDVAVTQVAGVATQGAVQVNKGQPDGKTVTVAGSFDVIDVALDGNMDPATFRIDVTGTDACGLQSSDSAEVEVVDTIPPEIDVVVTPDTLWPPNHKLRDIEASVVVTDNCPNPTFALTAATSDEPDNGKADGNTVNDIQGAEIGTADLDVRLRAERAGNMDGRIYTLGYTATDASKNTAEGAVEVSVPHDR
jgi:hypothetical protein